MDSLEIIRVFLEKYQNKKFKELKNGRLVNTLSGLQKDDSFDITIDFLQNRYDAGIGFKMLIKEYNLPVTYTKLKFLFDLVGIKRRKGYNIVTENLKKIRSNNAKLQFINKTGFFKHGIQENIHHSKSISRGIQGYYFNNSLKKYVWLRSSWEYIYAKWLDSKNIKWDVEIQTYILNNGNKYRPDFFIFDENDKIKSIIEVKGYWKDKLLKYNELKETSNVSFILITDIRPYLINNSLKSEITNWKKIRIINYENKKS